MFCVNSVVGPLSELMTPPIVKVKYSRSLVGW